MKIFDLYAITVIILVFIKSYSSPIMPTVDGTGGYEGSENVNEFEYNSRIDNLLIKNIIIPSINHTP